MRIAKSGNEINSVEDWFRCAPPKMGKLHWKDGRSAKELAQSWFRLGVPKPPVGQGHRLCQRHENNDMTAQYAEQISEDDTWRQTLAAKVGLGFQIPAFVPKPIVRNVRRNSHSVEVAVVS
jgi:hypothetical protein